MAAPKHWTAFDGNTTSMDTPYTIRAQQLRDLYNSITLRSLSRDERLDVLLTLKCTVKVGPHVATPPAMLHGMLCKYAYLVCVCVCVGIKQTHIFL